MRSSLPLLPDSYITQERADIAGYLTRLDTTLAGNVQGFIAMQGVQVAGLFVHPDAQGKGLGGRLLRSQNARTIEVFEANHHARTFYARHGFRAATSRIHPETGLRLMCLLRRTH